MTWADKPIIPGCYWTFSPNWSGTGGEIDMTQVTEGGGDTLWAQSIGDKWVECTSSERWLGVLWHGPIDRPAAPSPVKPAEV